MHRRIKAANSNNNNRSVISRNNSMSIDLNLKSEDCEDFSKEESNECNYFCRTKKAYLFCYCSDCKNNSGLRSRNDKSKVFLKKKNRRNYRLYNHNSQSSKKSDLLHHYESSGICGKYGSNSRGKSKIEYLKDFSRMIDIIDVLGRGYSTIVFECVWRKKIKCSLNLPLSVNFIGRYGFFKLMAFYCSLCKKRANYDILCEEEEEEEEEEEKEEETMKENLSESFDRLYCGKSTCMEEIGQEKTEEGGEEGGERGRGGGERGGGERGGERGGGERGGGEREAGEEVMSQEEQKKAERKNHLGQNYLQNRYDCCYFYPGEDTKSLHDTESSFVSRKLQDHLIIFQRKNKISSSCKVDLNLASYRPMSHQKKIFKNNNSKTFSSNFTEQRVVVKVIEKNKLTTKIEFFRAQREVYFSKMLFHQNVLPLLLSAENDKYFIMLFDYANKGDLNSYSKHKTIKEEDAKYLCKEVLKGLVYLHKRKIAHCDIKPENLLIFLRSNKKSDGSSFSNFYAESSCRGRSSRDLKYICSECCRMLAKDEEKKDRKNRKIIKNFSKNCKTAKASLHTSNNENNNNSKNKAENVDVKTKRTNINYFAHYETHQDCYMRDINANNYVFSLFSSFLLALNFLAFSYFPRIFFKSSFLSLSSPSSISSPSILPLLSSSLSTSPSQHISLLNLNIKICDFGLAQMCDDRGYIKWDGVRGSHGYIAPEVIHQKHYTTKVDCWALGIIVYTLLAGYEPFYPPSNFSDEQLKFDDRYWEHISEEAKDFIKNILKCNQTDRMSSTEALLHPWLQS